MGLAHAEQHVGQLVAMLVRPTDQSPPGSIPVQPRPPPLEHDHGVYGRLRSLTGRSSRACGQSRRPRSESGRQMPDSLAGTWSLTQRASATDTSNDTADAPTKPTNRPRPQTRTTSYSDWVKPSRASCRTAPNSSTVSATSRSGLETRSTARPVLPTSTDYPPPRRPRTAPDRSGCHDPGPGERPADLLTAPRREAPSSSRRPSRLPDGPRRAAPRAGPRPADRHR